MSIPPPTLTRLVRFACLLAFIMVMATTMFRGDKLRFVDERIYHQLAIGLVEGRGYMNPDGDPTSYRPPGYPFVLAAVYQVWPDPMAARVLNALLLAGAAALAALLSERLRSGTGIWAAVLTSTYPIIVYTDSTL